MKRKFISCLIFVIIITNAFAQTANIPLKKRAADAAKKYIVSTYTGAGIVLDEFEMIRLDTLTEHKDARIRILKLTQQQESIWHQAEIEGKKYQLLKEKTELTQSVYGDADIMTKMAISEQQSSLEKVKGLVSQKSDLGSTIDSLNSLIGAGILDMKKPIGYIVFVKTVFVNSTSGAIINEGEMMVRMNKNLRIIE